MRLYILIVILFLQLPLFSQVVNGEIDLTDWDFNNNPPVELSGEWLVENSSGDKFFSNVPGDWGEPTGRGVFTLNIKSSGVKHLLFYTSLLTTKSIVTHNEKVILRDDLKRSHYIPVNLVAGDNIFKIDITNKDDTEGGIRNIPYIGDSYKLRDAFEKSVLKDIISSGASFIIFILFLSLFLYHRDDKSSLYIALICLALFARGFVTNDKMIYSFISLPFFIVNRIEYGTIYFLPFFLLKFCNDFFSKVKFTFIQRLLTNIGLIFGFSVVLLPISFYLKLYNFFLLYALITSLYLLSSLIYLSIKKEEDAVRILLSVLTLSFASAYDINIVFNGNSDHMILSRVIIVFILLMAYIVSYRQLRSIKKIAALSNSNYQVNKYFRKFVPIEFIKTIGGPSANYIERGEGCKKEMTILFSSIKNFYKTSRLLKGEEIIELLNRCYSVVSPIIIKHGGFVDKFMDETIMCIFPNNPQNAINATIEISDAINEDNKKNKTPIEMVSGIHIGEIFVGIVGDENRVDATVISKVVNTASRIASFTKKIDKEILISEDVYTHITSSGINCNYMGRIRLKGNENSIGIYSVYSNKEKSRASSELEADSLFSLTMKKLEKSTLTRIENVLLNIKKIYFHHKPTLYYLKLIRENRKLEDIEK